MSSSIKRKPISRKFWSYLAYLPKPIRARLIRAQFEIDYELPKELIFKQAETTDEITQALHLVYQNYVDLEYMDANEAKLRLTKYNTLATTVILVAKWNDEVIGTLSIIPDSALGIPSDQTYNLAQYKNDGHQIAEISSLAIKKGFRKQRGKLLLPLCKLMYQFCTQILQLDGIIVSTMPDVEPFYTDVLLFEKNISNSVQLNMYVKGAPTTCCYLPLNDDTVNNYKKIYGKKIKKFDLHHFFTQEKTSNIQLPEAKHCLQAYMKKQNTSLAEILNIFPTLTKNFTEKEKIILKNIDISDAFSFDSDESTNTPARKSKRYHIKQQAWAFTAKNKTSIPVYIVDISDSGLKIILSDNTAVIKKNDEILIFFEHEAEIVQLIAKILWIRNNRVTGCEIMTPSEKWNEFAKMIYQELSINENIIQFKVKKPA